MNNAIVIGGNHHNTLGVIRSLGEKCIRSNVIIISNDAKSFVGKSKYIEKLYIISSCQEIVPCLLNNLVTNTQKAVIIACHDGVASIIDESYDILRKHFLLPGATIQGRITYLMNKQTMSDLATEMGLKIPHTWSVDKYLSLDSIDYPCIVKPLLSKDGTKADIAICKDKEDLSKMLVKTNYKQIQVQKYIDKVLEYQLIGCSLENDIIIPGYSQILRPCKGSNTSFLKYSKIDKSISNIDICISFIQATGYRGLFSIEFLRDKNNIDYFMEINFRNDGNAICVTAAGINLPYIWYLSCLGLNYRSELKDIHPVYVMPEFSELGLLIHRQITIGQFFSDIFKTNRFMDFDKHDLKPFWREFLNKISSKLFRSHECS